ncbi:MAG: succinate dehydrogenase cytochrome b subunit [Planctomycetota bacterium]|nr:succinate dehydrogenase cytochrome b subunit [Planctomycetota bacterium]
MSSIFKKALVALTGLLLIGFLVTHLAGNLYLFGGAKHFDRYAETLEKMGPLLIAAEVGLAAVFLVHVGLAIRLTFENKAARGGTGYEVHENQSAAPSRFMIVSGILIAIFIVLHIRAFKFGPREEYGGSLYAVVMNAFAHPGVAAFYMLSMLILGSHLTHGFWSVFQTFGLVKPAKRDKVRKVCALLGWGLALGFLTLPLFGLLKQDKTEKGLEGAVKKLTGQAEGATGGLASADRDAR